MDEIVKKDFFRVLRSAIWETELDGPVDNMNAVLRMARNQTLLPLFLDFALRDTYCSNSAKQKLEYQKILYSNIMTHQYINRVLVKIVNALVDNGIPYALLKGQGLASLYPNPDYRTCGDIDLYIGDKYIEQVMRLVMQLTDEKSRREGEDSKKHYHIAVDGVSIEIHRKSINMPTRKMERIYSEYEKEGFKRQNTDHFLVMGHEVMIPEVTFNVFYTFYHACHHFTTSGVGFRQLCDIAFLLSKKHEMINVDRLKEILVSLGLMTQWQAFVYILVEYLGLDREYAPFYSDSIKRKAEKMVDVILREGNFGQYRKTIMPNVCSSVFLRKASSLYNTTSRIFDIFSIFPSFVFRQYINFIRLGIGAFFMKNYRFKNEES